MLFYKVPIADNVGDAKLPFGETSAYMYSKNGTGE
jgi:hypothetical protein